MRKIILIAAAALATMASPALAQSADSFTGARAGVLVGTGGNKFIDFDGQTIGADVGYDVNVGNSNLVAGVGLEYQTDLGDDAFDYSETAVLARLGTKVNDNTLVYATGGYTRIADSGTPFGGNGNGGYRLGAGAEFGGRFKVEQRYLDYGRGANAWQTVAGLNFRF